MARIGYARVSTEEQCLDLQRQALNAAGCAVIFEDAGISGTSWERPGLTKAVASLTAEDVLVVWKLDRLGRSLKHLIDLLDRLGKAGVGFVSITENVDTTTAGGRLLLHMMAVLSEFERSVIAERTKAGMAAARLRGIHVGRPRLLSDQAVAGVLREIEAGTLTIAEAASSLGVSPATLRNALRRQETSGDGSND
ncbi:MAG: recombinase family protein [Rhodospirillaceae bacterium]|nr:recombinase family protein [Rhodospirillaceae bacterium]